MYTRLSLLTLLLCTTAGLQAHQVELASVSQAPYDAPPSGAMSNTSTGLYTEPQPSVSAIQPLVPNQNTANTNDQTQRNFQINPNATLSTPSGPSP